MSRIKVFLGAFVNYTNAQKFLDEVDAGIWTNQNMM